MTDNNTPAPSPEPVAIGNDGLKWPLTFDGRAWAVEFNKRFPSVSVDDALGWFCNAIVRGFDTHAELHPTPPPVAPGAVAEAWDRSRLLSALTAAVAAAQFSGKPFGVHDICDIVERECAPRADAARCERCAILADPAEIEQLRKTLDHYDVFTKDEPESLVARASSVIASLATQPRADAAAREDAARYRFLKSALRVDGEADGDESGSNYHEFLCFDEDKVGALRSFGHSVDSFIDAARRAGEAS